MRLFEFNYRLKAYLSDRERVPYRTGNLMTHGFNVMNTSGNTVSLVIGDARQVPYAIFLERGFRHYRSGNMVTKHKGWASRGAMEFAEQLARELGGVVTYD